MATKERFVLLRRSTSEDFDYGPGLLVEVEQTRLGILEQLLNGPVLHERARSQVLDVIGLLAAVRHEDVEEVFTADRDELQVGERRHSGRSSRIVQERQFLSNRKWSINSRHDG